MTATRTIHPHHLSTRIIAWTLHVICAVSLWATLAACHRTEKTHSILPDGCKLRAGDVVFRRGTGMTSRAVLTADVNGNYSHVGIVVDTAGQTMIVHAVPGEPDYAGDVDRVKMDTPSTFFSSAYASMGEICRPTNDTVAQGAARTALRLYRKGVLFDDEFNDKDTTKMYCTELIAYAFQRAGVDIVGKRRHKVDLAIIKAECILPSDIHASRHLRTIIMFHK